MKKPQLAWSKEDHDLLMSLHGTIPRKKIAEILGRSDGAVRARLGQFKINKRPMWTKEEELMLIEVYRKAGSTEIINLSELAKKIGKLKSNICRKARELGLETSQHRKKVLERKVKKNKYESKDALNKASSERLKRSISENGHPRGMLGKKHSQEALKKISEASIRNNAMRTDEMKAKYALKAAKTKMANGTYAMPRHKTTWKAAWRDIGGKNKFYRSKWEANYARYLQWLKENGQIKEWDHEPVTFWFEGVKRGVVSYLPDFRVIENDGNEVFHEVKGWMDDRSKTKIKRMAKYHPNVKLIVIDAKVYESLKKSISSLVEGWES